MSKKPVEKSVLTSNNENARPQAPARALELLSQTGPIAEVLKGFTPREQQQALAALVEQTLSDSGVLLAEAGTGTGKTLAYLVPCLDIDRKTIISTATKTLQDQLYDRDIPLVVKALGVAVKVALLKGRANYLCLHRLDLSRGSGELGLVEEDQLTYLDEWARHTERGDMASATELPDDAKIWPYVTSTVDNCLGQSCDYFDDCFVVKARREAAAADVVVVNHHLLFADMALREEGFAELLPNAEAIVVDEAHQIADVASTFFGSSLSSRQLRDLVRDTESAAATEAPDQINLRDLAVQLDRRTSDLVIALRRLGQRGDWASLSAIEPVQTAFAALESALTSLRDALEIASDRGPSAENCYNRALRFVARLSLFLGADDDVEFQWIRWFETTTRGATLHATPVSVAEPFQSMIESYAAAWIFTSATLSVSGDFSHFRRELGIAQATEASWDSPFDYAERGYLFLPRIPYEPRESAYIEAVVDLAEPLIKAARGRTFMLFTSHSALARAADLLRSRLDFPLLIQGEAPRAELLRSFEELGDSVLFGTATFWQGIDVRGPALSCVIIDKLPFAPPDDPVTRARISALKANGDNPFFDYQVPEAVLALKQGAGRLIRDPTDNGVLVLCDPRLETKSYGKAFLKSMPQMRRSHELAEVIDYLTGLA